MPPANNIWEQMGYVAPRGACNHKLSVLSAKCPCLRFMIHPHKMATSFECDGCGHHASFHSMENPTDNEVIKKWTEQAQESQTESGAERPRKRPRKAIENGRKESEATPFPEPYLAGARRKGIRPEVTKERLRSNREAYHPQRVQEVVEVEE